MSTFKDPSTATAADILTAQELLDSLLERREKKLSPYQGGECPLCSHAEDMCEGTDRHQCEVCPLFPDPNKLCDCTFYRPAVYPTRWFETYGIISRLRWYLATIRELRQWIETAWEEASSCS